MGTAGCELTPCPVSKDEWDTVKRVSPWSMHCMHCGMPKGNCQVEVMLNSEKSRAKS